MPQPLERIVWLGAKREEFLLNARFMFHIFSWQTKKQDNCIVLERPEAYIKYCKSVRHTQTLQDFTTTNTSSNVASINVNIKFVIKRKRLSLHNYNCIYIVHTSTALYISQFLTSHLNLVLPKFFLISSCPDFWQRVFQRIFFSCRDQTPDCL